jgi:hypothetical protein
MIFDYVEVGDALDFQVAATAKEYQHIIVNYHSSLFPWLSPTPNMKFIFHESSVPPGPRIDTDPTNAVCGIPRPLATHVQRKTHMPNLHNPVIGSFGFGFRHKNFDKIVELVQSQFDTATLRFIITFAKYGDEHGEGSRLIAKRCASAITKPGIKLEISHEFVTDEELVQFLESNDLNVFLYDTQPGRGCSSVCDFALATNRPFAISSSNMFRHVYDDSICVEKRPLREIMVRGMTHLEKYKTMWSHDNLKTKFAKRVNA